MRFVPTLLAALALQLSPAAAWDQSELHDVRFSADGRYFSFVETVGSTADDYGTGAIYVIDTLNDSWVTGTPWRVEVAGHEDNSIAALQAIRQKSVSLGSLYKLEAAGPALVPFREVDRMDPYNNDRRTAAVPSLQGELRLDLQKAASAHFCENDNEYPERPTDFRLVLAGEHELTLADYVGDLPQSRGCAHDYDIAAAYLHEVGDKKVLAVLVGVYTRGWEGSDRNLIAVTKVLP